MPSTPGPAQLELIRRYARTLRELQSEAAQLNGPRVGARGRHGRQEAAATRRETARFTRAAAQAASNDGGSGPRSAPGHA